MAIEEKRIYELTDEQTTLTDADQGVLDKSGYTKAKKFTMLNLFLYIFSKTFGSLTGKAYGKVFVKSDESGLEIKTLHELTEANPILGSDQIEVYRTSGGTSWKKAEISSLKSFISEGWITEIVTLDSDDLGTLNWDTGFDLTEAFPDGYFPNVREIFWKFDYVNPQYNVDRDYLSVWCGNSPICCVSSALLTETTQRYLITKPSMDQISTADEIPFSAGFNNTNGLKLQLFLGNTSGGSITSGNGTLTLKIVYKLESIDF